MVLRTSAIACVSGSGFVLCALFGLFSLGSYLAQAQILLDPFPQSHLVFCFAVQASVASLFLQRARLRAEAVKCGPLVLLGILIALTMGALVPSLTIMVVGTLSAVIVGDLTWWVDIMMDKTPSLIWR